MDIDVDVQHPGVIPVGYIKIGIPGICTHSNIFFDVLGNWYLKHFLLRWLEMDIRTKRLLDGARNVLENNLFKQLGAQKLQILVSHVLIANL